jgi:hypothetical protein
MLSQANAAAVLVAMMRFLWSRICRLADSSPKTTLISHRVLYQWQQEGAAYLLLLDHLPVWAVAAWLYIINMSMAQLQLLAVNLKTALGRIKGITSTHPSLLSVCSTTRITPRLILSRISLRNYVNLNRISNPKRKYRSVKWIVKSWKVSSNWSINSTYQNLIH